MFSKANIKSFFYLTFAFLIFFVTAVLLIKKTPVITAVNTSENSRDIPVIMYHSVYKKSCSIYVITPEEFEADILYLKNKGCEFVSIGEIYDFYTGNGELPQNPVAITFDDGFLNNMTCALPIMEKYGVKANINVVGSFTEKYSNVCDRNERYACLTWDDIKKLNDGGLVEIGNHTWDMHSLGSRNGCSKKSGETDEQYKTALKTDVQKLNAALFENCGITTGIFAFPYGEISKNAKQILVDAGFKIFLTCEEKINTVTAGEGDILTLKRINRPSSMTTDGFMKKFGL